MKMNRSDNIIRVYGDRDKGIRPHHKCLVCEMVWEPNHPHPKSECKESGKYERLER